MYDDTCRYLAEHYSSDFAQWLLGEAIALTIWNPTRFPSNFVPDETAILLRSPDLVLHLEFHATPDPNLPLKMADYRLRVYKRCPDRNMKQVVLYLQPTDSEMVRQTRFTLERTTHEFDVIRLWEYPSDALLQYPGLVPLAVLGQTSDLEGTLRQVAAVVSQVNDSVEQANLTASAAILAGLRLDNELIYRILRRDIMQESTVYQSILAEGEEQTQREIAINLLQAGLDPELIASTTGLSLTEVQQLQQQVNGTGQ